MPEVEGPDAGSQAHELANETTVTNPTRRRKTEGKVMRSGVEKAELDVGPQDGTSRGGTVAHGFSLAYAGIVTGNPKPCPAITQDAV
jgi:hypothetical protein